MLRKMHLMAMGLGLFSLAAPASAVILVSDNFSDGDYTTGTSWTSNLPAAEGSYYVNGLNQVELSQTPSGNGRNVFPDGAVPYYLSTTFAESALSDFQFSMSAIFYNSGPQGSGDNYNVAGAAILDASGQNGYHVEFSRVSGATGYIGMNIRRVTGGVYVDTIDLDGRLAEIANGNLVTRNADGSVNTSAAFAGTYPAENGPLTLSFTRTGSALSFTVTGAASLNLSVTDPNALPVSNVGQLRIYGFEAVNGHAFDEVLLTTSIPEPASASLALLGAAALFRRRK